MISQLELKLPPFLSPAYSKFTFIDLFSGIGGFRLALQNLGGRCVFSSEIDSSARETYFNNFGDIPHGDIKEYTSDLVSDKELDFVIPNHDVLAAGFPCQPFSIAGVSARQFLGYEHGFRDSVKGNLFFDIVRIIQVKKPKVVFLENVRNFKSHDNGGTFNTVKEIITEQLGYNFSYAIINSSFLVPQKRVRCYMVCTRDSYPYTFPTETDNQIPLKSILEKDVSDEFTISEKLWEGHQRRSIRNKERGTGFTVKLADINKPSNTLVARYYKDGKECLIPQDGKPPRMLTPRECARLQGFPEEFIIPNSKMNAYKQFGNSVVVPLVQKIAANFLDYLEI